MLRYVIYLYAHHTLQSTLIDFHVDEENSLSQLICIIKDHTF